MRGRAALASLWLAACAGGGRDASPVAGFSTDPEQLERGRRLFNGTCAGYCHAAAGRGLGSAPDLLDCEWRHGSSDEQILAVMRTGVPGTAMLGFAGRIPDDDLLRVLAWLRSASRCPRS